MVTAIREADRDGVPAVARRHEVSEQTLYAGKKAFGDERCWEVTADCSAVLA